MTCLRSRFRTALVVLSVAATAACGGDKATQPAGSNSGGANRGTLTAVVDGVPYTGIVNTATNINGVLNVASNNAALTLSVNFATRAGVGTTSLATGSTTMNVITTNGSTVTGSWGATNVQGSGSITISTLTSSGASGTFNFVATPAPPPSNAGATGTKTVTNGAFSVTF